MPAAVEWFANIDNPRTRRGYQNDLEDFCGFVGLTGTEEFRAVTRGHVLAWRAQLEARGLAGATIRRKLAALANLFDHLLESKPFQEAIRCTALNGPGLKPTKSKSVHIRPHARDLYPSG